MGMAGKPVEMVFEFDSVRNFSSIILHTNNMFSKDVQVIYKLDNNLKNKTQLTKYAPQKSDDERGERRAKKRVPSQSIHYGALVCIKKFPLLVFDNVRKSHAPRLKQKKTPKTQNFLEIFYSILKAALVRLYTYSCV